MANKKMIRYIVPADLALEYYNILAPGKYDENDKKDRERARKNFSKSKLIDREILLYAKKAYLDKACRFLHDYPHTT